MLKLQTLTIRREGQVDWHVVGDRHCGPVGEVKDGLMPIRYAIEVTCRPRLDGRGFLFDQAVVDSWMRRLALTPSPLSCERLAQDVGERMMAKMAKDVPHCDLVRLVVTLSPSPFLASVTAAFGEMTR